jgi:type I restriction-modification system DNA methylase subunit
VRSNERKKKLGEVFTPLKLLNEILDRLPEESWSDKSKTFLDPTSGNGNFLIEVVRRKIEHGSTPVQALSTTYGVDIMTDNVTEAHRRLLKVASEASGVDIQLEWADVVLRNVVKADALTYKFDFMERERTEKIEKYLKRLVEKARTIEVW